MLTVGITICRILFSNVLSGLCLLDELALDSEDEGGVGRNVGRGPGRSVTHLGRDGQLASAPNLHAQHPDVPALNNLASAKFELKRLPAEVAVKLFVVCLKNQYLHLIKKMQNEKNHPGLRSVQLT